jgi:geranylgeranyl transferase type-2 subunit beta
VTSEYLRMSGVYWCVTAMDIMGELPRMTRQDIVDFVRACQKPSGGLSSTPTHDEHLLHTLSAVQVSACAHSTHMWSMRFRFL